MHVLEGARIASLAVFNTLFKTDISSMLDVEPVKFKKPSNLILFTTQNEDMEFMRLFIEFERALESFLIAVSHKTDLHPKSVKQMWEEYKTFVKNPPEWDMAIQRILPIRNSIAHGNLENISPDDIIEAYLQLMDVTETLQASV